MRGLHLIHHFISIFITFNYYIYQEMFSYYIDSMSVELDMRVSSIKKINLQKSVGVCFCVVCVY